MFYTKETYMNEMTYIQLKVVGNVMFKIEILDEKCSKIGI